MSLATYWNTLWRQYGWQLPSVPFDIARYALTRNAKSKSRHILVACMPKSGSTYLSTILSGLPGFRAVSLIHGGHRQEHELDRLILLLNKRTSYVAQHHIRYSEGTGRLFGEFGIQPIVLIRDIFDATISLRDHIRRESHICPMGHIFPEAATWDDARLEEFLACMCIPWYFNFYLTWLEYPGALTLDYEQVSQDPFTALSRINAELGLNASDSQLKSAIERAASMQTRKNKGVAGRGAGLTAAARQHILRMADLYPDVDFAPIGIPNRGSCTLAKSA